MPSAAEVLITGAGVLSPIGLTLDAYWRSLEERSSGVGPLSAFEADGLPVRIAAEARDFDPKALVRPRKSLKVMVRDAQLAVAAADLAFRDAGLAAGSVDPDRIGVVLGADRLRNDLDETSQPYRACCAAGDFDFSRWGTEGLDDSFPLGFLKVLPNMLASHISILLDARGPNNTLHCNEISSLAALAEGMRLIERGAADVVLVGGASSRMHPLDWVRSCLMEELSRRHDDPAKASRPFDAQRDGQVRGEGASVFVLESRQHAEARHARVRGRLLGYGGACEPRTNGRAFDGSGLMRAIRAALADANIEPHELGHVNAHGMSTVGDDRVEATALRAVIGDVPVTAPKSFFGNLAAASGAVEMVASLLAFEHGRVPVTLNYEQPDRSCPVAVVHDEPLEGRPPVALQVNQTGMGQAAALVIAAP